MSYDSRYEPTYDEELVREEESLKVFNALVVLTDYDSFAMKGMEVYYGDDYEHIVTDLMYDDISDATDLPVWAVRDYALDACELMHMHGKWHSKTNGMWKEWNYA
jgi:hypothetical protein